MNEIKFALLSMTLLLAFSCSKEESTSLVQDQIVTSSEVKTILDVDDYSSVVDSVVTDLFQNGESSKSSKTNNCYTSEFSDTGYAVTFDNCSVDGVDNINGSLTVVYEVGEESTAFTATYTNLTFGDLTINGTRGFLMNTSTQEGSISFSIVSDMSIELADGSIVEEMGTKNFAFAFDGTGLENSTLTIDGDWTVKVDGSTYTINITTPLKTNIFNCGYIGEGVMSLNKNGLAVTIDFGDGTCDDVASLTYPNGTVEEISLKDN